MPTLFSPTTVLSPWSHGYAISPEARLMTAPNTRRPRQPSAPPTPATPPASAKGPTAGSSPG